METEDLRIMQMNTLNCLNILNSINHIELGLGRSIGKVK